MNIRKLLLVIIPGILLIVVSIFLWKKCTSYQELFLVKEDREEINHHMIVQKIESLGKLELVKYYIKDIIEHEVIKDWWPDPKVVLIVSGEVVGCINLTKIDSSNIQIEKDQITIKLPNPEICYFKINHAESKVHSIENEYFSQPELVDKAYQLAEKQLEIAAIKMKILEQTKVNAEIILRPFLEELTGKKIFLKY